MPAARVCGLPNGWGRNFEGGTREPGQASSYDTNVYPWVCMAYRIPQGTRNNMLIYVNGVGWRSITMTQGETPTSYPKVGSWNPLITDDQWHHKCINLDAQMDQVLGSGTHNISAVIWHDGGGMGSVVGSFWIDEFRISNVQVVVDDGIVTHAAIEAPGQFEVSSAEAILKTL